MGLTPQQIASQMEIGERYKQLRINARLTALQVVGDIVKCAMGLASTMPAESLTAETLIKDAEVIENYIMKGITPPAPVTQPSIVPANRMPG